MTQESGPKPKKPKMSEREAESRIEQETFIEIHQNLLATMQEVNPTLASTIKPAYDEYINTLIELMKINPEEIPVRELRKRIPHNTWLKFFEEQMVPGILKQPLSPEEKEEVRRTNEELINKKRKGEDIN